MFCYYHCFAPNKSLAVHQPYETRVGDEFVIVGNDVLVKCDFPGFASDFLDVVGWKVRAKNSKSGGKTEEAASGFDVLPGEGKEDGEGTFYRLGAS